ncbi:ELKS/Rab6-interacting/CAST family protein [Aestuariirhabdus sp. Z084]|uniref:ELKS/Rab6-interacting/CAST family protein n=1 Tax=Aestuariirhabdus haliotis TaxID=2918751 RepID=UPI00201B419A|nr:ELKS/Rab6-interacting/CAST family protein [Aestuariirhabdus haliotis]MCL6417771.1 ELKS/Rab6-interacting/CAST family protein [Aestuariirhabdus haliotis]MCL6421700.1 ELKS/Rab6-interacting/CAST family protein [Aestuariirhabdus haliotis]
MRFLCPRHRNNLDNLEESDLASQWFEWMHQAAVYYELGDWREAIAYSGCSLELSMVYLSKTAGPAQINACKNLCLSTLYCMNCLVHNDERYKANYIMGIASKVLEQYKNTHQETQQIEADIQALQDEAQHDHYFKTHLNFPFDSVPPKSGLMHH